MASKVISCKLICNHDSFFVCFGVARKVYKIGLCDCELVALLSRAWHDMIEGILFADDIILGGCQAKEKAIIAKKALTIRGRMDRIRISHGGVAQG